jgi:hypothetical protein
MLQHHQLEGNHILHEMLENIENFCAHEDLDIQCLKDETICPVLEGNFNPDVQIRGLLKVIRKTSAFIDAYDQIHDESLKKQIDSFIGGQSSETAAQGHRFQILSHPSPAVRHEFSLLEKVKGLISNVEDLEIDAKTSHLLTKHATNIPIIFENESNTKIMEVSILLKL